MVAERDRKGSPTIVESVDLSLFLSDVSPVVFRIVVLIEPFLSWTLQPVIQIRTATHLWFTYNAVKFMVYIQSADIPTAFRYSDADFFPSIVFHDFRLDPDIFR